MSNISLILKDLRTQKDAFQKDVANDLNIETNTYGSWERGNTEPPIDMLITLAKYYGVSVDYLVGIENEDYTKSRTKNDNVASNKKEKILIDIFRELNNAGKEELLDFALFIKTKQ